MVKAEVEREAGKADGEYLEMCKRPGFKMPYIQCGLGNDALAAV